MTLGYWGDDRVHPNALVCVLPLSHKEQCVPCPLAGLIAQRCTPVYTNNIHKEKIYDNNWTVDGRWFF